jgi:nucleoside-diphosphate-sugar epimerase
VKGRIRVAIESMFRERAQAGRLRTIVVRAGDFIGDGAPNSWMQVLVAKDMRQGKLTAVGGYDTVHAWAYLPDLAETVVRLAEVEGDLRIYEVFHFESQNVTMRQLRDAAQAAVGRKMALGHLPRLVFSLMGLFDPMMKATIEMLYLWDVPHALKDDRLAQVIGPVPRTPLVEALKTLT